MPNFSRLYTTPKLDKLLKRQAAQREREREWPDTKDRTSDSNPFPASTLVQRLRALRANKQTSYPCDSK